MGGPFLVPHRVKSDITGVDSQVVFDHNLSVAIFIPMEYLYEYETDYLSFTSW